MTDQTIEEFNHIFAKSNVLINLENNKFQCTCKNLDFLNWMYDSRYRFLHIEKYVCSDQYTPFDFQSMEKSLHQLKIRCLNLETWIIIFCMLITLVSCILTVLIFKKNIWHIRYYLFSSIHYRNGTKGN